MGYRIFGLGVSLDKAELVRLLLQNEPVELTGQVIGGTAIEKFSLTGCYEHSRYGHPTEKDFFTHILKTIVLFEGRNFEGRLNLQTKNNGETYEGAVSFTIEPEDNLSE